MRLRVWQASLDSEYCPGYDSCSVAPALNYAGNTGFVCSKIKFNSGNFFENFGGAGSISVYLLPGRKQATAEIWL